MDAPIGIATNAAANYDLYSGIPVTPTRARSPELPQGLRAYGGYFGPTSFTVQLPALVEDIITLQLAYGCAVAVTLDRTHQIETRPGDLVVIPRGNQVHFTNCTAQGSLNLVFALPPQLLQMTAARDLDVGVHCIELRPFMAEQRDPLLYGIGWALFGQLQAQGAVDRIYLEALVTTLAVHVLRSYATTRPRAAHGYKFLPPTVLQCVCDYIEAHLDCELTLEALGRVAQYSPYHLSRLFRTAMGQTLHQYVTTRRLAKAKLLLETSDLPLQQIAQQTGFSDQSHLSKHFRRAYGYAPSAERKAQRRS